MTAKKIVLTQEVFSEQDEQKGKMPRAYRVVKLVNTVEYRIDQVLTEHHVEGLCGRMHWTVEIIKSKVTI